MALQPFFGRSLIDEVENMVDRCFDRRLTGDWFDNSSSISLCPIDLIEQEDSYVVKADVPGMDKKDVKIHLDGNKLTLVGERKEEKRDERGGFTRYERSQQGFTRTIVLPKDADKDKIEAKLDRGVLSLSIPRLSLPKGEGTKMIEIK